MQVNPDYYQLLGVNRAASKEEIESAFRALENEFHASGKPRNIDDVEWLRTLVKAHAVLSDQQQRKTYDQTGTAPGFSTGLSAGYDFNDIREMKRSVDEEVKARRIRWAIGSLWRVFWG